MTERTMRATLDRIVDGEHAVLLLEDDDGAVVDELVVDVDALPAAGCHEGAVLRISVADGRLQEAAVRDDETERRRDEAQGRLDRLSSRLDDSGDDEDG